MKLSKIFAFTLVAATAISAATPVVKAHNLVKYTGVPFVVPAQCGTSTSKWVTQNGKTVLQVTVNADDNVGFQIFNSSPSSNVGTPSAGTGIIPTGTLSFTLSGLPSGGSDIEVSGVGTAADSYSSPYDFPTTTNGTFSYQIPAMTNTVATSPVVAVTGVFYPGVYPTTIYVSNFRLNNAPLLLDTTQSTSANTTLYTDYCTW